MEDWEGWENGQERPRAYHYNQLSGYIRPVSDAELRHNAAVQQMFGYAFWLGIMGMAAYYLITHYAWTTAAVVMGVLVLFSLFTVGIMRTGGIILRFALWAFLLVVMSAAFSMLWSAECEQLTSGLQEAAVLAMAVSWLYVAIKLFRLVF